MYIYLFIYFQINIYIYMYVYVCMHVCMHACMHVCMYIYIYIPYLFLLTLASFRDHVSKQIRGDKASGKRIQVFRWQMSSPKRHGSLCRIRMQQVNVVGIVNCPMKANDVPLSSMAIFDGKLFHHQSVMTIVVPKEIQKAS